jgi:hypothetical protein
LRGGRRESRCTVGQLYTQRDRDAREIETP